MKKNLNPKDVYINFPISLLSYFEGDNIDELLINILAHGLRTTQWEVNNNNSKSRYLFNEIEKYCSNNFTDVATFVAPQENLHYDKTPYAGIKKKHLFNFLAEEKTIIEQHALIFALAGKSIIGERGFTAISWKFWKKRAYGCVKINESTNNTWAEQYMVEKIPNGKYDKDGKPKYKRTNDYRRKQLIKELKKMGMVYIPNGKGISAPIVSFNMKEEAVRSKLIEKDKVPFTNNELASRRIYKTKSDEDIPF